MRSLTKKTLVGIVVYAGLWALTWWYGPGALRHQIYAEALPEWQQQHRPRMPQSKTGLPSTHDLPAYAHGPVASAELLACPAPFVIKVDCGRGIDGSNGYGWIGWYIVTPWHLYEINERGTWES